MSAQLGWGGTYHHQVPFSTTNSGYIAWTAAQLAIDGGLDAVRFAPLSGWSTLTYNFIWTPVSGSLNAQFTAFDGRGGTAFNNYHSYDSWSFVVTPGMSLRIGNYGSPTSSGTLIITATIDGVASANQLNLVVSTGSSYGAAAWNASDAGFWTQYVKTAES